RPEEVEAGQGDLAPLNGNEPLARLLGGRAARGRTRVGRDQRQRNRSQPNGERQWEAPLLGSRASSTITRRREPPCRCSSASTARPVAARPTRRSGSRPASSASSEATSRGSTPKRTG